MSGILAPFPATPIQRLDSFCGRNELYMKRDDLLPFCFGGNKARIAAELVRDMLEKKATCMVAYGSTRSNLSRALACACSSLGVRCVVVSPSEQGGARPRSFNSTMVERLGAQVVPCDRGAVRETVASTLARLRSDGERPYYIYGDETGHGNERVPVAAYEKVGAEISRQEAEMGFRFDAVYLATGTGMTQAGLVCWNEGLGGGYRRRIVGISVARLEEAARAGVLEHVQAYLGRVPESPVEVLGGYLHGGYGQADEQERGTIASLFAKEGVPSDETYVGKAFDGMLRHLETIRAEGRRVLFVHTGGAPLFFDDLER